MTFPYVFLDATYCKAWVNHWMVSQAVVGARLFGAFAGLSAVPVWPVGWSPVLYIYASSPLG
jgi:hypothetical protein